MGNNNSTKSQVSKVKSNDNHNRRLSETSIDILVQISNKSKEEILLFKEQFYDDCPTGKMTRDKFIEFYKLFRPNVKNIDGIARHCFIAFDQNNDGFVDFGEFLLAYVATTGSNPREKLNFVFDMYDKNNDKLLTGQELRQGIKTMIKLLGMTEKSCDIDKCIDNIMVSLDQNNDNKISKKEFIEGCINDEFVLNLLSPF
jgi:neuronal calcium sensor 1